LEKEYKTVLNHVVYEIEEKKSRFIASVRPVSTEEEAVEFIEELKSKYWDATHNVYAYYIGGKNIIQKFSDDGEPSGTAGLPVLEVIKRMGLRDVAVVVTRYFTWSCGTYTGIQQKCLNGDRGSPNCDKKALHPGKYNSGVHFVWKGSEHPYFEGIYNKRCYI